MFCCKNGYVDREIFVLIYFAHMNLISWLDCLSSMRGGYGVNRDNERYRYFSQLQVLHYQSKWVSGAISMLQYIHCFK